MTQLLVVVAVAVAAAVVATVIQRRRPEAPTRTGASLPDHLDRADFDRPEAPWLVAVFTSSTCGTCADVLTKAAVLASDEVAVCEVEYHARGDLHRRYRIDAVPGVAIADAAGEVRSSFLGPVSATHLWAALAELREPGSVGGGCDALGSGPREQPADLDP